VVNPKGLYMVNETSHLEQVQAITTLRSGKLVDNQIEDKRDEHTEVSETLQRDKGKQVIKDTSSSADPSLETPYVPRAPFSERLKAPSHFGKQGEKIQDMMETFKQVKVNIPLLDAIKQVPAYAKFLKDLSTQKRNNQKHIPKKVILIEQVSSQIQHNTPPKFKDPGTPTISCVIGNTKIERTLRNLGAGVNLLPYSVYQQLGLGELKPTSTVLQLADRSIKKPRGIVEDVLIKVDKFYYPVDFIVLDTEPVPYPNKQILVILGRLFLATTNACINCHTGVMKISFGNMKIRLNIFTAFQNAPDQMACFFLDDIGKTVKDPPLETLFEAPGWRNPPEPMPLTSSTPPPDDNPTRNKFHAEVSVVDFIGVDNFSASSQVVPVCVDTYRDKGLIMEPVRDKQLGYGHEETQDLSSEGSSFKIIRRFLFLLECYMIIKKKGWKSLIGLLKDRGKILWDSELF
jgi:hypothetical protein